MSTTGIINSAIQTTVVDYKETPGRCPVICSLMYLFHFDGRLGRYSSILLIPGTGCFFAFLESGYEFLKPFLQ